ncbi:MAG TPA: TonB-dependent receptor [Longimicrobiaceae bacterium]|nr:TonB-dependent receptor [Longimicrobiaceae bacterium]
MDVSGALLALFLLADPAAAPRPDTARVDTLVHRLPTLRVEVARLQTGGVPLARAPFAAQVVGADELRAMPHRTVADVLARLPGVSLADVMGSAFQPDVSLRGFGVSPVVGLPQGVSVFVDGVRVNEPDASQVHWDLIPLDDAERIEVVRGPAAAFGKNALAGSLNVVTRRGGGPPRGALEVAGGGFRRGEARGSVLGGVGPWDYYLSGNWVQSGGWRDDASARVGRLFAKGGWRGERTDAWLSYTRGDDRILQAGSLPASWLENRDSVPERWRSPADPRTINFTGGDLFRPRLHFLNGRVAHRVGAGTVLEASAFARENRVDQFNANFTEPDTRFDTRNRSAGVAAQLARSAGRLELASGVEYALHDVGIRIFALPNENFPGFPAAGEMSEDVGTLEHDFGAYAQARLAATERLALTGSLRWDYVSLPFRDRLDPDNDGDNLFRQLTGALGVDWVAAPGTVLFAGYGRGFRAPVIMELACADPEDPCPLPYELGADPPLDPVTTDTWQAGVRFFGARVSAEAVAFRAEVYDDIFNVRPQGTAAAYFQNLDRTRREGVELAAELRPAAGLRLHGNLAFTRATFQTVATLSAPYQDDDDDDVGAAASADPDDDDLAPPTVRPGDHFPMVPAVRANLGAEFASGPWRAAVEAGHVGSRWLRGDEDNTEEELKLAAYTLVGLRVERAAGRMTVYAEAENLLDADYRTFGVLTLNRLNEGERVEPFVTPGTPRRIGAGVRWRVW